MAMADVVRGLRPSALRRSLRGTEARIVLVLGVISCLIALSINLWPWRVPSNALIVPLLVASLILRPKPLSWFVVFLMVLQVDAALAQPRYLDKPFFHQWLPVTAAAIGVNFLLGFIVMLISFRRSRLGVGGLEGESMFVDLRDRILTQGDLPELPVGWHAEKAIASASGTLFAGDFVVTARPSPHRFEVALIDVSGKGEQAGTRALQLSGALGGLIGAVPPAKFLLAANEFLLRQDWDEGFATAVHLALDLATGGYELRTAGHPPALLQRGSQQTWQTLESGGPVLGLIEGAEYAPAVGTLASGDTVLLYTDGMVERPKRDIDRGIERLGSAVQAQLARDGDGVAQLLVDRLGSKDDDRCLVMVGRR
jgi:hypothetical protein